MSSLHAIQTHLQEHLLFDDKKINQDIVEPINDSSEQRLLIYNNGYHFRLLEALSKSYEILHQWIGDDAFYEMAYAYIDAYPSRYFSVDEFTKHLAEFLAQKAPYNKQPYLSELAQFIAALSDTVTAADATLLFGNDIAAIPQESWSEMRIALHPSVKLFTNHWNILAIWKALVDKRQPPSPISTNTHNFYVVWRKGIESFYISLDEQQAAVLQGLQQGLSFGQICEKLTEWYAPEEVAQHAVNFLVRWLNDGMLSEVTV